MIGTLLDAAEAEQRSAPTRSELWDLRANGLRQHGLEAVPLAVRSRASSLALGLGAALALVLFVGVEWAPWVAPGDRKVFAAQIGFGPFVSAGAVVDLLWIIAFVTGMLGRRMLTSIALLLSIATSLSLLLLPAGPWISARPSMTSLAATAVLALIVLLANPAADSRGAGWTAVALGVSLAAIGVIQWGAFRQPGLFASHQFWQLFPVGWVWVAIVALMLLFAGLRWWAWCGAAFFALAPWWIGLLTTSVWYLPDVRLVPVLLAALFLVVLLARTFIARLWPVRRA